MIAGDAAPLPAAASSRPRAWADANDQGPDTAGVMALAGWSCSRAAACDALHPFASRYGGVMLATRLRLGVLVRREPAAEPFGFNLPVRQENEPVITGPALASFAARNNVAPSHVRRAVMAGLLS